MGQELISQGDVESCETESRLVVDVIQRLAHVCEYREDPSGRHPQRVGDLSALLARALGWEAESVELLRQAAKLHDVGKVGVPEAILLKKGDLSTGEFEELKHHTVLGHKLLSGSPLPVFDMARDIALSHHESWDGSGYPRAIKGEATPQSGRIVALADFFDALTHDRPYRKAFSAEATMELVKDGRGTQFDPGLVDAFLSVMSADGWAH